MLPWVRWVLQSFEREVPECFSWDLQNRQGRGSLRSWRFKLSVRRHESMGDGRESLKSKVLWVRALLQHDHLRHLLASSLQEAILDSSDDQHRNLQPRGLFIRKVEPSQPNKLDLSRNRTWSVFGVWRYGVLRRWLWLWLDCLGNLSSRDLSS